MWPLERTYQKVDDGQRTTDDGHSTSCSGELKTLGKKPLENILGNGQNAGKQHFILFPQCFPPFQKQISIFHQYLLCSLQIAAYIYMNMC